MEIHHLRALVSDDFEAVNALIIDSIQSEHPLISEVSTHIVQSGGKRLRPLIVLLSCHACQYQGPNHILLAALIELFHTATLLHDDVIDESTLRRGRETANEIWGSNASILVGNYLFMLYSQLMITVGDLSIMRMLTDISLQIGRGEILQLSNQHKVAPSVEDYFEIIRSKTSLLFAASACLGAKISQSSPEIEQGLYHFGLHLGNAFQLIDDALDYCSDAQTIGKNIGNDLADGKATLPLLYALQKGTALQQQQIKISLEKGTLDYLPEILNAIASTNAIEYTHRIAKKEIDAAVNALQILPNSIYKEALSELTQFAINRDH